ncbi:hypothetical protein BpHYR1_047884 [Brachionus plicatilis]|uniref:Uncharacterized protein n=1 Tax=Brachionus plicatilis TaxID=10195 RepID=A0A3M7T9X6_BRAPC|nr:hypothetical protein BpHYR1_047884 [Brachionus plicatilis]
MPERVMVLMAIFSRGISKPFFVSTGLVKNQHMRKRIKKILMKWNMYVRTDIRKSSISNEN